ncbi:hypothetical protein V2J09_001036 [Rumex salicifolius]
MGGGLEVDSAVDAVVAPSVSVDHPANKSQQLPVTTAPAAASSHRKLTLIPLVFLIYFEVAGGPFGEEPAVQAAGPLLAILGFLIFPFIWSVPEALITAELATAYPGDGGFVIWAERAFGPFWGSLLGTWKFFSGVVNIASFPVLGVDYAKRLFPIFNSGLPRTLAIVISTLLLSFLNYTGLTIVGWAAVALGMVSLAPFLIMSGVAIPQIKPKRWLNLGQRGVKKDWNLFFNTLFWNLNFWDSVSTLAGEVEKPKKTFPRGLFIAVIFTCLAYLIPLMAATGAVDVDQSLWESGFLADASKTIVGKWVKIWIEIGAVLSAVGLFEAQMSSCTYQILGMADIGFLPRFCAARAKWFNTPWVGIVVSCIISLGASFLNFDDIVASANFLYSLGMLLEFAAFVWLRYKKPTLKRPFRVPMKIPGLIIMCLVPSAFLVFIMTLATPIVLIVSSSMTVAGIAWYGIMRLSKSKKWCYFAALHIEEEEEDEDEPSVNLSKL